MEYLVYSAFADKSERVDIYQYLPLTGDPTPAELKVAEEVKRNQKLQYWQNRFKQVENG